MFKNWSIIALSIYDMDMFFELDYDEYGKFSEEWRHFIDSREWSIIAKEDGQVLSMVWLHGKVQTNVTGLVEQLHG